MSDGLKHRAISGGLWSVIHKFATVFLGFISGIVLARLLTPHDYGIIGMLTIFLAISNTFIDGGFGSALIQKKNPTDIDYSTILYWNLAFSIFFYLILYVCAPYIAFFYDLPLLRDVLRVQGVVLIFNAARIVQRNQLRKQLQFKKIAIINSSSSFFVLLVTIFLAWKGWGVWALVAQQLLVGLLTTIIYWVTSKWKPMFVFSWQSFKELFGFGGFILLSNLFNTFCNNIQGLLIGKVYNSSTLGFYTKAINTERYASTFVSSILDQLSYPVLSEVQNERLRMVGILKKFINTSAFVTFPMMALLILLAKPIFILLYSDRWLSSVPYFQILCVAGIAMCLQNVNYYAVGALGKSKELFKWTIVKRVLGLCFVILGLSLWGIYGLLVGSIMTSWTIYLINAGLVSRHVGYKFKQQIRDLLPIIVLSFVSFLIAFSITLFHFGLYVDGLVKLIIYGTVFLGGAKLFHYDGLGSSIEVVKIIFGKLIQKLNFRK